MNKGSLSSCPQACDKSYFESELLKKFNQQTTTGSNFLGDTDWCALTMHQAPSYCSSHSPSFQVLACPWVPSGSGFFSFYFIKP